MPRPTFALVVTLLAAGFAGARLSGQSSGRTDIEARLAQESSRPALSAELKAAAESFIADKSRPPRDRLMVKIQLDQSLLRREAFPTERARRQAHADHAGALIREFPNEPEGYGYLLSLARSAPGGEGTALAEKLLADSRTPDAFRPMARRVVERAALAGQALRLAGAEPAISRAARRPLVIYSWRASDQGFLQIMRKAAAARDVEFIGINLDKDVAAARKVATTLPGTQFYDGGELEGPMAQQLKLVLATSVYLVDSQGVLRDIDAHAAPLSALAAFVGQGGAR